MTVEASPAQPQDNRNDTNHHQPTTSHHHQSHQHNYPRLVDIGVNLNHKAFRNHWREVVQRSIDVGVDTILITGTCLTSSRQGYHTVQTWRNETSKDQNRNLDGGYPNLYCTIGIHPHDAKSFDENTLSVMRDMFLQQQQQRKHGGRRNGEIVPPVVAVAVGECGLDFNRNFSPRQVQIDVFKAQVQLACELHIPLFVHERDAHLELLQVLDDVVAQNEQYQLPPIVIHCFTGTLQEAQEYIRRGYYIGFTGMICKPERGAPIRQILPHLPLDRIMLETDAPFMSFPKQKPKDKEHEKMKEEGPSSQRKQRRKQNSEPADVVDVAHCLADTIHVPFEVVCETTTNTAIQFFRLQR